MDKKIIEKIKQLDAATISDAMDKLGIECGLIGIKPINPGKKICGQAFTVKYEPRGLDKGTVGDYLDDVEEGQVVVLDNSGRLDCTVWGDILSLYATTKNVEGTIIDGVCRDVPDIKKIGYPIYTKGHYMVTGKDRVQVKEVGKPVSISNVQVKPGDIIFGDDTGVLVIPQDYAEEVIKITDDIEAKEVLIREALKAGKSLREARAEMGYHTLQTKGK